MKGKKVLIVDDDPQIVELVGTAFAAQECIVKSASTGPEGLALISREPFDLFVFDVHLPAMSGLELLSAGKELGRKTPVIMISGMATEKTRTTALRLGAVVLLDKPFEIETLVSAAREAMSDDSANRRDRNILVADDHEETRDLLNAVLDLAGYDVRSAADGDEAMQTIRSAARYFDFAILDLHMPGLSGPQLVEAVSKESPKTLVVFMTGEASTEEIAESYKKGGATLIRKPFRLDALVSAIIQLEHQADEKRQKGEIKEAFDRLPIHKKAVEVAKDIAKAPPDSKPKRILRGAVIVILVVIVGIAAIKIVRTVETALTQGTGRINSFFDRIEGYLQRDEQREVDREKTNK